MRTRIPSCDSAEQTRVTSFDSGKLENLTFTPQGYLRAPAIATRVGVLHYNIGGGKVRRVLRHPDDVFARKSLDTLAGIPVTYDHPNMKNPKDILLDASTTRDHIRGYTGDTVEPLNDKFVSTTVTITDSELIEKIRDGIVELSCGYTSEHEEIPGTYDGEEYDVRQRNIIYNHLSVVPKGRAGPDVKILLDSADAVQVEQPFTETKTMKLVLNGVEFEVQDEALATAIKKEMEKSSLWMQAKLDSEDVVKTEKTRADRAEARADAAETEVVKVKEQLSASLDSAATPEKIREAAKARVRVLKVADRVLSKEVKATLDSLDDKQIIVEVLKVEAKNVNLDGKSDDYLAARFDLVAEALDADGTRNMEMGANLQQARLDSADTDIVEAAKKRQAEYAQNQWKAPATAN